MGRVYGNLRSFAGMGKLAHIEKRSAKSLCFMAQAFCLQSGKLLNSGV